MNPAELQPSCRVAVCVCPYRRLSGGATPAVFRMRASETKQDEARQKRLRRLAKRHGLRLRKPYPMKDDEGFTIWEVESEPRPEHEGCFRDERIRELAARSGLRTWSEIHAANGHR